MQPIIEPSRANKLLAGLVGATLAVALGVLALNFVGSEARVEHQVAHQYGVDDPQFLRELGQLLGPPIVDGNRVGNLENGAQIFPSMLEAVRSARNSITFETYIYWSGAVGREFANALAERARAGVKVHVLLDWVGSQRIEDSLIDTMESAGVEVELYHPLHWYHLARMNQRTHRKLLVVDGRIGFTGGVGIADEWDGNGTDPKRWRDSHYRLEGPAVAQMQGAFMDNWIKTTGRVLQGDEYFPALEPMGDMPAQVFTSSPSGGGDSMMLMYLLAIASAERSIDLSAAYFVPDPLTSRALIAALGRGVVLRIIVPGEHTDAEVVQKASRSVWGPLLAAGALIYQYEPTLFHCKALIVDRLLVSVGSTNFDNRSFRLNDEANLNVYDSSFAEAITRVFEDDLTKSRAVTFEAWTNRPLGEKISERLSSVLGPQL